MKSFQILLKIKNSLKKEIGLPQIIEDNIV